ncbi:MAG: hypothetical protein B9S32_07310 [Verrucomicrobia bacterium Tous-C9LFEB]|nr:MAG: hypothetical protein B9S32_07310 [Verrucomicrobia bacterium Tous-C9LFEB]
MKTLFKKPLTILLCLLTIGTSILIAQSVYSYKCPRCNAIYSYSSPGSYKCPGDGWTLTRTY